MRQHLGWRGSSEGFGPIRTVIADDDAGFLRLLTLFLRRLANVELLGAAVDGRQAVEIVLSQRPRLALLDLDMPGVNGLAAAAFIHRYDPATRVIILTNNDAADVKADCLATEVDGFVSKRAFLVDLPRAINEVVPWRVLPGPRPGIQKPGSAFC